MSTIISPIQPKVGPTSGISCKAPICSGFVSFIPLFDGSMLLPAACPLARRELYRSHPATGAACSLNEVLGLTQRRSTGLIVGSGVSHPLPPGWRGLPPVATPPCDHPRGLPSLRVDRR